MVLALKCTGGYWFIKVTLTEQEEDRGTKLIAAKEEILFFTQKHWFIHIVFSEAQFCSSGGRGGGILQRVLRERQLFKKLPTSNKQESTVAGLMCAF